MKMNNITNAMTIMDLSYELKIQGQDNDTRCHVQKQFFKEVEEIGHTKALLSAKRRTATALGATHNQYQSLAS